MNTQAINAREWIPAGIEVDAFGPELTITRRWSSGFPWREVVIAVVCDSFLVVWYGIVLYQCLAGEPPPKLWLAVIGCVPHCIAGLCLTYYAICCIFNRSVITLTKTGLTIRHGPLPLLWGENYSPQDFQQLFCREVKRQGKGYPLVAYELFAWNRDDSFDVLLTGLEDLVQAHFLEQRIERYLGLTKERVPPGYIPRRDAATAVA